MTDLAKLSAGAGLTGRLAALATVATDESLTDGGRYFEGSCDDLTKCGHGDTGEYQNSADGELIEALWNAYRTGQLVERDGVVEACANIVGKAMTEADINGRDEVSDELYQVQCAICNLYTATLTATAGTSHD